MKKLLLLLFIPALMLTFAGCKKDKKGDEDKKDNVDVNNPPNAKSVVIYVGGTWCPPCGQRGKPALDATKNEFGSDVNIVSIGVNSGSTVDPMNNPSGQALRNAFGQSITGVPAMFVGGPTAFAGVSNATTMTGKVREENANKALVHGKPVVKIDGNKVSVDVDITFFEDYSDEYRCAVYLTEDNLNHRQSGDTRTGDRKDMHDGVIRLTLPAPSSATGETIAPSVKKGQKAKFSSSADLQESWKKENMKAVVVFWRKAGNGFAVVGGESTKF
jgi:thiol-disulfide isomerase/thioredoxin